MMNPIYQLHNLTQTYGSRTVLHIDALDILAGEILAIVGPSGAGKSTLLRQLGFLEGVTNGRLSFHNQPTTSLSLETRRKVTLVFQKPRLLNRSVAANAAYGLKIRGVEREGVETAVSHALEQVGLSHLAHANAHTLSGGEAQRVALARALVLQPDVLLLDEPTANLDPQNIRLIENIVREINQRGTTVVLVTHNIFQARRLADRTAFLLDGKLVEVAETAVFFSNPQDKKTAAFVQGDMVY